MSKYVMGQSSKKAQIWLQRLVKFWLASGMIAMPWMAQASTITRTDGGPAITPTGAAGSQVHNIYAGKDLGNKVGVNTFSQFDVTKGDVANMHFSQSATASPTQFNTLLNFVDNKININGTVNAIRDAKIGGHLFFLSPNGMAVGANGVINAGALTVLTPTNAWWKNRSMDPESNPKVFDVSKLTTDDINAVNSLTIPINSTGTIAIQGRINVTNDLRLKAAKINIGADADGNNKTAAVLQSGVVDFSSIVNIDHLAGTDITDTNTLKATVDANGGDIIIAAEVSVNENDCAEKGIVGKLIEKQSATAEVNVVGGSSINAYRNVDITALAVNNVELGEYVNPDTNEWTYIVNGKEISEEEFKSQYQSENEPATAEEPAKLSMYGSTTKIYAKINVTDAGTEITGENINIKAEAKNVYHNVSDVSYLDDKKLQELDEEYFKKTNTDFWFSYLMNGMDVVYADMTTEATVTIGQDTVVIAKAPDREETVVGSGTTYVPALQISANATTEIDLGTQALSINATDNQTIPGVGFIWGMINNKSNVTVAGTLQADKGSTSVQSVANAKVHENADTGYGSDGRAFTSDAGFNFGVVVFVGKNEANLDIKDTAKMTDLYGNITIGATAVNNLDLNNVLKTSDKAATAFGISWMDFKANANVNIATAVESKNGNLTTFAESTLPTNNFITYAEAGDAGFFSAFTKDQRHNKEDEIRNNIDSHLSNILTGGTGGSNNLNDTIQKIQNAFQTSDQAMKDINSKVKMGITFGAAKQTNVAKVNIASTGSLKAKGDVKVTAKAAIDDLRFQVYGSSSNAQIEVSGEQSGKDLLANGAIMLSSVENDADITIENGSRKAIDAGGAITMRTDSLLPYNRINKMVGAINQYVDVIKHSFDNMKDDTTSYSANDIAAMEAALADFTKKATALQAELYDENGNLKPEYADSSDGYSALIEKINAFTEDPTMQNFTEFVQGGTYTYTDDQGQQHSVKFDNKTGSGADAGSSSLKDTLTKVVNDLMLALGGIKGLVGAALDFAEPANYVNYYVGSATKGNKNRDLTTNVALAIDLGMTSTWNKSRVIVGSGAQLIGNGNIAIDANTEANDASLTGKIGTTGGGKKASVGAGVGLADVNNLSMITFADNSLVQGKDVSMKAKNYTNHVAVGELLNYSTGNEGVTVNGIGLFVGGSSDSIISVDDEADINATGVISLLGENTTNGIMVGGGLACGNKGAESLTFGMMMFNRNNLITVGDNDAENLSDADIEGSDDEKTRLKKLVAQQSGMDADTRKKYFGTTVATNKGEITAISLTDKALSDGDMVNVVMDIGYGSDTASQTADKVGQKISNAATSACNTVSGWCSGLSNTCNNISNAITKMVPSGNAGNIPTTSFSGAGSVAINDIKSHTLAMVDGTNITLVKDNNNAKVDVYAEDTGTIVSVAGGVGYSGKKGGSGQNTSGSKTGVAMAGGAAVNLVDNYTTSQISNSSIEKAATISNKAVREGLLVAAGAAVNVTDSEKGQGTGVSIGGSTSINIAHYGTIANMENNTVNENFTDYKTNLTNEARNQDAQGSGCLNLSLALQGKSGGAVGGVIAYDEVNNDVGANMTKGGTYKNMGVVVNMAKADLTQIQAALGMGIYAGQGGGTGVTLEGSAAVGIFRNKMKANVDGITLVGDAFTSKAFDENFENANSHIAKASAQGLDLTGDDYIKMAKDEALKDGETLQQSGNTLVNVAVQIGAAAGKQGTDVAIGAAVGVVESDNEYVVSMNNSNITADNVDTLAESSTLEVGVAAGGNGSGKGFGGGGAVAVTLMNDKVIDEVKASDITADVLTLQALNKNELVNVTGEVAVGADKKASAVGLDVTYNYLGTVTKTLLQNTNVQGRTADTGTNLTMLSKNDADYYSVAVGVAIAGGDVAVNGSVSLNQGRNDTYAMATGDGTNTLSLSNFDVHTYDDSYYCAGAGGLGLTYGKNSIVAVGGAVAYNQLGVALNTSGGVETSGNTQQNIAEVSGYNIKLTGDMDVHAYDMGKMLTVGVGVGLGGKVAVQGASADTFLYKNTKAGVYDTNVNKDDPDAQGNVDVYAETSNKTESIAVVVSGTTGYAAVGAGVNVVTMKGDTSATLAGGTYKVDDVLVNAKSYQKLLSNIVGVAACVSGEVTIAIGGSVTVSNLTNNTYATLGYSDDDITGGKGVTKIDADGNVGVLAQSDEDFENYTGQVGVSVSKVVAVGAGAAVAVNKVGGNTVAKAQNAVINTSASTNKNISLRNSITGKNETYNGLIVDADAYHKFYDAPYCGGLTVSEVVSVAADATVGVDEMGGSTKAEVYSVSFNKDKKESIESGNDFVVQATDKTNVEPVITNAVASIAAGGAISVSANVGAGVGTFKNERIVESVVTGDKTDERYILNADKVKVNADNKLDFKAINTAVSVVVSAGTGSVSGTCATGVLYVDLDSETKATISGVESTNNGISLTSNQDTDFDIVGTSVAVAVSASLYGASLSVGVHVDTIENNSETITLLDNSNIYHYEDNIAEDVISAKSNYKAHNQDCNVSASASIASGAVGVLVVDNELNNVVTADVKNSTIGTADTKDPRGNVIKGKQAKDINVISLNNVSTDFDNQNIAAAVGLSVGVGVGLSTVDTSVASNVTSSTLYARDNIDVNAEQNVTMLGEMVAVPVGALSVGVSTLHNYLGVAVVDDQYEDWEDETISKQEMKSNDFSSKDIDNLVVEVTKQGDDILNNVETSYASYGETPMSIDSMQKVARNAVINSEGAKVNLTNANLIVGNDINAKVKQTVNADPEITAVGVGAVAVNVETNRIRVKNDIGVNVIGGYFEAGHDINLNAATAGTLKADTIQVGVGGLAVGVAVGEITKDGNMGITLNTADMVADNVINVSTMDNMGIRHTGTGSNDGGLCATAVDYKAKDNLINTITLKYDADMGRGNNLEANNISIHAYSVPDVYSEFLAVSVALAEGCGVVMESDINNQAYLTLEDKNRLWADTITLDSGVYADSGKNNLYTDVLGVGVAGVAVHVNKSRTYTNVVAGTTVGTLTLKTEEVDDEYGNTVKVGKSTVKINAFDGTSTYNHLQGVTVGVAVASGSNYSLSKIKSNVYTTVDAGNSGIYAKDLTISANGKDTLKSKADGDGGGVVGISPEAAVVETEVDGKTKTTITGYYNVTGTMSVNAVRTDDLNLNANAINAQLAGGSGTRTEIKHINEDTSVNLSDATIDAYGKLDIASDNIIYVNKDNSYAVDGNGYGGADATVSNLKSTINTSSVANIDSVKINAYDAVNIGANTTDYVVLANSVFSAGIISSNPCATTDANTTITDRVVISDSKNKGTEIRTKSVDKDLIVAASDHTDLYVRAYTEAECGFAGVVAPNAKNNLTRNSSIELNSGTLYGARDIKLYSGKEVSNSLGYMNLRVESEAFNGNVSGVIPIDVSLSNNVKQNNTITIGGAGDVRSIRHVELYADAGRESITKVAEYHTWCYSDSQDSGYVSTSSGSMNGLVTRDNYVEVNGNVTAGLANCLTINIGTKAGEFVIVGDQEREMVTAAYTGTSQKIYSGSDEDKAKFITFGNADSQAAADSIGLTIDDFVVGRQSYSVAVGNRLNEINALLSEYGEDSDPTVKAGLEAEQARLLEIMATMGAGSSGDTVTPDMIDYILIPELAASGGNITVNTQNFRGSGKLEAKGSPVIEINNYTNLMLVTQKITMDDPGGVITYNNNVLVYPSSTTDGNMQQQVQKINVSDAAVNLDLKAAEHVDDPQVNINGKFGGSGPIINFKGGMYYLTDDNDSYITYDPKDAVLVTFSGSSNGLYYELITDENKEENYNYYIDVSDKESMTGSSRYYFTKDIDNAEGDALATHFLWYKENGYSNAKKFGMEFHDAKYRYYIETSDGKYYLATTSTPTSERVHYQSGQLKYDDGKFIPYDTANNNQYYDVIADGNYRPKADIQIAGNINSLKGIVNVTSDNNSITMGGESVTDDVSITAKVINLSAPNGSITQTYTDGTVSVGGDVKSQYEKLYSDFVNAKDVKDVVATKEKTTSLIIAEVADGTKASPDVTGSWIAGGQVYIAANDININGTVQSGYDKYTAEITAADQKVIDNIVANWTNSGKQQLTDSTVKNSGNAYLVKEGGAYWNATRKCYEYRMNVYYNPSTQQLLTADVNANGGRITLTGRIASTGNGNVICLDGAYNITVSNKLDYDLRVGELAVNDTQGLISITDPSYYVTHGDKNFNVTAEITTAGTKYKYYDTIDKTYYYSDINPEKFTAMNQITGSGRSYTYQPEKSLRYEWVTGYTNTEYTRYYTEQMAKWWGAADYKQKSQAELDSWIESGQAVETGSSTKEGDPRTDGAYLSTATSNVGDVYFKHTGQTVSSKTTQEGNVQEWSTGFCGCHKWRKYTYVRETGNTFSDFATVKASVPITITMIGVAADDSVVDVNTTKNLYFGQMIGNSELYTVGTDHIEKGTVNLISNNGSVIQEGGNIYGATVNLSAKNDLQNISIVAGDTVDLTGILNGTGQANVVVEKAYGGGAGNVILHNFGGTNAAVAELTARGSIIQDTASNLVQAKRINLTSGGSVSGRNGAVLYLIGGQDVDADSQDTLRASVSIDAYGDVSITQKSGDLRVGTIYSKTGNVNITVPDGSIHDALPYVESDNADTEAELIAKWESMALIDDDDDPNTRSEGQISKDVALVAGKKAKTAYEDNIRKEFDDYNKLKQKAVDKQTYTELKAKVEAGTPLTPEEQLKYDELKKCRLDYSDSEQARLTKYNDKYYNTETSSYYADANDYLTNSSTAQEYLTNLQANVDHISNTTYEGWNKYQLLYALQDSVINQHAGVKSSGKAPNIYANNVNLVVKNDVGLNSPNVTVIDMQNITMDQLKELSRADAATVSWIIDPNTGHKIVTIREKLAIGLHQVDGNGRINITTTDTDVDATKNIFMEVRKGEDLSNYLSLVIGNISTANGNGDVRISSLKDILTVENTVLSARDVVLLAGESGTNDGNIGSADRYFGLNMTGKLTATATGNIYLSQSAQPWQIGSMTAGVVGDSTSDGSGNIFLRAQGNIYGVFDEYTDVQTYIQSDSQGNISIESASGSIGDWDDKKKVVRVKNSANQVILKAAKDITLEGVSTNVGGSNNASGLLNIASVDMGGKKLRLTVNGELDLGDVKFTDGNNNPVAGSVIVLEAANLDLDSSYIADDVRMLGTTGIVQQAAEIKGNTVTLTTGEKLDLTCGVMSVADADRQKASIVQHYNNSTGSGDAKVIAKELNVNSYGMVDMGTKKNQFGTAHLNVAIDTTLGGGVLLDSIFNGSKEIQLDITNTHPGHERVVTINDVSKTLQNVTNGDVDVRIYATNGDDVTNLTVNKDIYVAGDGTFVNATGKTTMAGTDSNVYTKGVYGIYGRDGVLQEKNIVAQGGIAIFADGDIHAVEGYTLGTSLYMQSFNGDVYDEALEGVGLIRGSLTMIADNGAVYNSRAYLTEDDITLRAKKSITNSKSGAAWDTALANEVQQKFGLTYQEDIGMRSLNGDITIYTMGDGATGEGTLINDVGLKADNGFIMLYANKGLTNNAIIDARDKDASKTTAGIVTILSNGTITNGDGTGADDYIYGQNGVYLVGKTKIENKELLYATKGNIVIGGVGEYDGEGAGLITDTGAVVNSGNMYTESGNVRIVSAATVDNTGHMFTEGGDVTILSKDKLSNTGTMYAMDGEVRLQSLTSDIHNTDDFRKETGAAAVASGTVTMLAEKGSIYNEHAVYAGKGITVRSYGALGNASTGDYFKGFITVEGDINLTSLNGGVSNGVVGASPVAGMDIITGKGNITIKGKESVVNVGSVYSADGDIVLESEEGDVINTYSFKTKETDDYANGSISLLAENGSITNTSALRAKNDITMKAKNDLLIDSDKVIVSETGNIIVRATDGLLLNNAKVEAKDGNVTMFAKSINNYATNTGIFATKVSTDDKDAGRIILAAKETLSNTDGVISGQNGVYMVVGKELKNAADIKTEIGDIVLVRPEEYDGQVIPVAAGGTKVTNSGNIYVATEGNVILHAVGQLNADGTLSNPDSNGAITNTGSIQTLKGNITITADGDIQNLNILTTSAAGDEGGDITIRSEYGSITHSKGTGDNSNITATEGAVIAVALKGDVTVDGKIDAYGDVDIVGGKYVKIDAESTPSFGTANDAKIRTKTGSVIAVSGKNLTNNANIWAEDGNVSLLTREGNLDNKGFIFATKGGSVHMYAGDKAVNNGGIFALGGGAVSIVAKNDLTNSGNVFTFSQKKENGLTAGKERLAYSYSETGNTGSVGLFSEKGNVTNHDDFVIAESIKSALKERFKIDKDVDVKITEGVFMAYGSVVLDASKGSIENNKKIIAYDDISFTAKTKISNQSYGSDAVGMRSITGDVLLASLGHDAEDGVIVNEKGILADNGSIIMTATKSISNTAGLEAKVYTYKEGDPEIRKNIQSNNEGGIVSLKSGGTITNTKSIKAENGISILAVGDITNGDSSTTDSIAETKSGSIVISSVKGEVTNYANLKATGVAGTGENAGKVLKSGNVIITAKKDVTNTGSIFAKAGADQTGLFTGDMVKDGGWIGMISTDGNIINVDKFAGETGFDYADGSIWLEATKGYIENDFALLANNNVTVKSLVAIDLQNKDIKSLEKGDVTIYAFGKTGKGVIRNMSTVYTANGDIYIEASGSVKVAGQRKVYDKVVDGVYLSIYNEYPDNQNPANISATGGNVTIKGERGILDEGNVLAVAKDGVGGYLLMESNAGGVMIYDHDSLESASAQPRLTSASPLLASNSNGDNNILRTDEGVEIYAPYGALYNEKDIETNGYIKMTYGGGGTDLMITANNNMHSTGGDITLLALGTENTKLVVNSEITADKGDVLINSKGSINVVGDVSAKNADINIGAVGDLEVTGDLTASLTDGLLALGTEKGEKMSINGTLTGNEVILYTENSNTDMCFDSIHNIYFGDEIILAGNKWNDNNVIDMTKFVPTNRDVFNIRLYSAGGTYDGANYNMNFGDYAGWLHIGSAVVDNLTISTNGRVTIEDLSVSNRADIYTMGIKTSVYGQPLDYDGDAVTIYYAPGRGAGASIWLHDMFFDGTPDSYRNVMNTFKTVGATAFESGGDIGGLDGNGQGMYLDIRSATEQTGTGKLLKTSYGVSVYKQRYSLEQLMQNLLNFKAMDAYNEYFNKGIEIFQRYNLVEIPDVTVNQPVELKDGSFEVEGLSTNAKGEKVKKVVEYQF